MRPDRVVNGLVGPQFPPELVEAVGWVQPVVELLLVGSMGSLYVGVEFGGTGRQNEQLDTSTLALCLEVCLELRSAVNLDCPYRERHPVQQALQELTSSPGCSLVEDVDDVPATHHVSSREVLVDLTGQKADVRRIHPAIA